MKNIKLITGLWLACIFLSMTACDDFMDVNTDPNNPGQVRPNLILPLGQHYTATYMHGDRRANHLGNMIMFNWSEAQGFSWYDNEFQYNVTTTFYSTLFDNAYTQALKQYHYLTQFEAPEYAYYVAIGEIMKAYHFQLLVDFYGDVPYTEALGRGSNATPAYDDAQTIYNDLIVKLNNAITMIVEADEELMEIPGADDAMFHGDMLEWIRFANSVKVRILTRMSGPSVAAKANQQFIVDELEAIFDGVGIMTSDVIINPGYLDEENKQNPFWAAFGAGPDGTVTLTNDATAATQYVIDLLTDTSDPRIDQLYEHPASGHLGINQGIEAGPEYAPDLVSNIGPGLLLDATQGSIIMTAAEMNFNLAELALKFADPTSAEQFYYDALSYSFAQFGVLNAMGDYIAANDGVRNVDFSASTTDAERLEAIITQKWIAVNGTTAEQSWFDWSRTGYPSNLPLSLEAIQPMRPVRLFYPASEKSSNASNVPAQPDAFTDKIFWAN